MTTADIDHMVYAFTTDHDAIPAPFLYEGFPKSVCTSLNDVVCHGIPSPRVRLKEGDILNVDVSTIYKGYFSDASRMYIIGQASEEARRLVQVAPRVPRHRRAGCPALGALGRRGRSHPGTCREERLQRGARLVADTA